MNQNIIKELKELSSLVDKSLQEKVSNILEECQQNEIRINKIFKMGDRQQNKLIVLNNALEKAKKEILLVSKSKSDFISGLSHELRTSLNAIIGYAQLFQYNPALEQQDKDNATEIYNAGLHLLNLVNDILEFSSLESGRSNVQLTSVAIAPIIKDCISLISPKATERMITIHQNTALFENIYVTSSPRLLKQILLNLLSNAVKYNYEYGDITINCENKNNDRIKLTVSDTGLGLSDEQLESLFLPFERLGRESLEIEGSGLGLSITQKLVESMNGEIGVIKNNDKGCCFWVELDGAKI